MGFRTVEITTYLVEIALATGATHRAMHVTRGLPPGAKLVGAEVLRDQSLILCFEHESFGLSDEPLIIEVTNS